MTKFVFLLCQKFSLNFILVMQSQVKMECLEKDPKQQSTINGIMVLKNAGLLLFMLGIKPLKTSYEDCNSVATLLYI